MVKLYSGGEVKNIKTKVHTKFEYGFADDDTEEIISCELIAQSFHES